MIDIQRHIDSLDALKDYMWYFICSKECERQVLEIYFETGLLMSRSERYQSFDEWHQIHGWRYEKS